MNFKNKDSLQTEINLRSCRILGVNVHGLTLRELHDYIFCCITQRQHALVLNVNVHCLNLAYEDSSLRHFLNNADLVFWASKNPPYVGVYYSQEKIIISNIFNGLAEEPIVIGVFDAFVLSEVSLSRLHPVRDRIFNNLSRKPKNQ